MKRILRRFKDKLTFKDLPPAYRESDGDNVRYEDINPIETPCNAIDLLANCNIPPIVNDSDTEYAEIQDMGIWHSTPLSHRHKSKISLTWVLKENLETIPDKTSKKEIKDDRYLKTEERYRKCKSRERVVGRNEYYHNLRLKSACAELQESSDTSSDEHRRRHRHRHVRKKRTSKFGYDIRDLDSFLSEASIDRPGNIPVVVAYPSPLYQTHKDQQKELLLPLGTVVNAVFKNQQWLYAQTPHGDEGYVMYNACLPLGILPNRTSNQKKTPCWESSTDIYPRPCGNLTDNEKEQLRGRSRSESRYKTQEKKRKCAEKDFDTLYLKTKSVTDIDKLVERKRQTLLVVNSDYKGSDVNRTLSVQQGDVVVLAQGGVEAVDTEWFYVKKNDGSYGFIPAAVAGHGYI